MNVPEPGDVFEQKYRMRSIAQLHCPHTLTLYDFGRSPQGVGYAPSREHPVIVMVPDELVDSRRVFVLGLDDAVPLARKLACHSWVEATATVGPGTPPPNDCPSRATDVHFPVLNEHVFEFFGDRR